MVTEAKNNIRITLPSNEIRSFNPGITGFDIASNIGKSIEKKAIAIKINGELKDLSTRIESDSEIEIITTDSNEGLEIIRHDAAHILAQAVKELYPETQITIGPTIENGFYYDFARQDPFTANDLEQIEMQMRKIIARNEKVEKKVLSRAEAIKLFKGLGEKYKIEIINDLPENVEVTVYSQGDFVDLCRGPHSPSTGIVKAFKLLKVAGAYWRGDSKNEMLHRIYGTAWATEEQLKNHLTQIEEAEKRDHRKLGKEMDLFHFQEEAPGAVFWHPKGWTLFQTIVGYLRRKQLAVGYQEIGTPELLDRVLWEQSGHWESYRENMFSAQPRSQNKEEGKMYAVRPMNCPGGLQVYKHDIKSYKDLPLKLSEFGKVYRYEPSGSLHGLLRLRAFTQDDAHIYCTEEQITEEGKKVCNFILEIYRVFGFQDIKVNFSDRPEKRIGSDETWDKAESALKEAAEFAGLKCILNSGEGAFYGPKLEFVSRDAIGREWQLGTLQVDLNMPVRLGATYIDASGHKKHPVMLHRAMLGSLERFLGILIEHYAGKLPLWLSPIQVVIATITNDVDEYARTVKSALEKEGIRTLLDLDNEKISYKIRKHSLAKLPIILALGKKEQNDQTVSVRRLGADVQETLALNEFVSRLKEEVNEPF